MNVYLFGWPDLYGGASTRFAHLIRLLPAEFTVTVVPNEAASLDDPHWTHTLRSLGVQCRSYESLPERLEGWGLAMCNGDFLASPRWSEVRRRGLRMAWSSEMMWVTRPEMGALTLGLIDAIVYVSEAQRRGLEPEYERVFRGTLVTPPPREAPAPEEGWIEGPRGQRLRWIMTSNYIDPGLFPFRDREAAAGAGSPIVVGRLSRPDPHKFPTEFPRIYEGLGLRNPRFRVMAWTAELAQRWAGHTFDNRWTLLPAMAESPVEFLQSLDLFIYSTGAFLRESWGRAVVEAMLTGAIPIVPRGGGHHLDKLMEHGVSGFTCATPEEFGEHARRLEQDPALRFRMSRQAREWAVTHLCDVAAHRAMWHRVFRTVA